MRTRFHRDIPALLLPPVLRACRCSICSRSEVTLRVGFRFFEREKSNGKRIIFARNPEFKKQKNSIYMAEANNHLLMGTASRANAAPSSPAKMSKRILHTRT
jgi:hypothetical protein